MNIHESSKTKIIATIGPASSPEDRLRALIISGIDICRLNFSHGSHEDHKIVIDTIRKINLELGTQIAIMGDLQGPKIRLGEMKEGVIVNDGEKLIITNKECTGTQERIYVSYKEFPEDARKGEILLIDDGKLKFKVESTDGKENVVVRVIHGGPLKSRKGVNLPHTKISVPSLTRKDEKDAKFILEQELEWMALSFVRSADDIINLKRMIRNRKKKTLVMAKIEKPEAVNNLKHIIEESDAVMVARGDLGVEVSFEKVPLIQKQIVQQCIKKSTPVVIATQMLESMITNFRPTRAEANDVANAVFDGADAVMLSGETSVGEYPVEAIQSMQQIIDYAEGTSFVHTHEHLPDIDSVSYVPDSVCYNACKMADQSGAKAIVAFAVRPETAFRLASNRPKAPIYIFTPNRLILHQLSLIWGVRAFFIDPEKSRESPFDYSLKMLRTRELIRHGDLVVNVSSLPLFDFKGVSAIKLSYV